jgi:sortase A
VILPPIRIVAPAIGLDAPIVESPIVDDEWVVPQFEVGHLVGSGDPLGGGNIVLAGHVESYNAGHVFARIGELEPGDAIRLFTTAGVMRYVVQSSTVVPRDDMSILLPGPREKVTLITCAGVWVPQIQDYDRRRIVVATLVG